jgi:hypothetical protein
MTYQEVKNKVVWAGETPTDEDLKDFIDTLLKAIEIIGGIENIKSLSAGKNGTWYEFRNN